MLLFALEVLISGIKSLELGSGSWALGYTLGLCYFSFLCLHPSKTNPFTKGGG